MADNEPDKSEKTEPASPYKLLEARKKGSVAKSMEVNTFTILLASVVFLMAAGHQFVMQTLELCIDMLASAGNMPFELRQLLDISMDWVQAGLSILAPLVVIIMIVAVVTTFAQVGPVFSFFPMKPDITRLDPVKGFQRLFSMKLLFETIKSFIKLALFGAVIAVTLYGFMGTTLSFFNLAPQTYVETFSDVAATLVARLLVVIAFIAVLDLIYTRWDYQRNLRMTLKEVKDENKRREGDPQIRQKRRSLEIELRKRSESLANVRKADVVVTNPTRYAVVLKYDRQTMHAPQVTGKGAGEMARLIREEAYRHRVPVIHSPSLARKLFRSCAIYGPIAQEHYVVAAQLFREAFRLRAGKGVVA